jgi:hypothetical protein
MKKWIEKKPEVRRFKKWESAWLAAIIDGEGSVGLYDYGREGRRVQIQMGNSDEHLVLRMREVIGCGTFVFRTNIHKSHKGRKPMYQFALKGSNRCYWVLKQVLPFLITKKDKASAIISELEDKPFGRWANATEESRKMQSDRMKKIWQQRKKHS